MDSRSVAVDWDDDDELVGDTVLVGLWLVVGDMLNVDVSGVDDDGDLDDVGFDVESPEVLSPDDDVDVDVVENTKGVDDVNGVNDSDTDDEIVLDGGIVWEGER